MTKRKLLQCSLWLTALLATVFLFFTPILRIPLYRAVLFWLLVFLPQVIAIIFQFKIVKHNIIEHKKALEEYYKYEFGKEKHDVRLPVIITDALHNIAELKSMGIHPNRAGPIKVFA